MLLPDDPVPARGGRRRRGSGRRGRRAERAPRGETHGTIAVRPVPEIHGSLQERELRGERAGGGGGDDELGVAASINRFEVAASIDESEAAVSIDEFEIAASIDGTDIVSASASATADDPAGNEPRPAAASVVTGQTKPQNRATARRVKQPKKRPVEPPGTLYPPTGPARWTLPRVGKSRFSGPTVYTPLTLHPPSTGLGSASRDRWERPKRQVCLTD